MKKTKGSRSLQLFSLAAKVGSSELMRSVKDKLAIGTAVAREAAGKEARLDQARAIVESLSQLKGAAMKAGQLLSIDAGDYFPPDAVAVLSQLQASAKPLDFRELRPVLVEDISEKKIGDFDGLESQPAAAASIGQVHRATLNGKKVAIKIQYPGVAESIESDLAILKNLAGSFVSMSGRQMDLAPLFTELRRVLEQEANYVEELGFMQEYRERLQGDPLYRVPEPFPSHSGRRVLTMSWEAGAPIDTWLKSRPSIERRERVGRAMLSLFCREFFEWGLVQTDPNFANFLIAPDDALVLLDFGATLRYDNEFRLQYTRFLSTLTKLDPAAVILEGEAFGLISPRESDETKRLFAELVTISVEPFFTSAQPFRFENADYAKRTREAGSQFARSLKYSPPPQKILFLHRKLGGLFNFVKRLDVAIDLRPYWEQMVGHKPPEVAPKTAGTSTGVGGQP